MTQKTPAVMITKEEINKKVSELGKQLANKYRDLDPVIICPLKGSFVFTADLVRAMDIQCEIEFMIVSSYGSGTVSSGSINIKKDIEKDIKGRHIIIAEDIIDTGNTLFALKNMLLEREPASVSICTLLDKPSRRTADIKSDYSLFVIPDKFVVGYGMDADEKYRQLPYIGVF